MNTAFPTYNLLWSESDLTVKCYQRLLVMLLASVQLVGELCRVQNVHSLGTNGWFEQDVHVCRGGVSVDFQPKGFPVHQRNQPVMTCQTGGIAFLAPSVCCSQRFYHHGLGVSPTVVPAVPAHGSGTSPAGGGVKFQGNTSPFWCLFRPSGTSSDTLTPTEHPQAVSHQFTP